MVKNTIIIILLITFAFPLLAQLKDEDIFTTDYQQKSARKAILYSTLFPGAGQLYANPKAITGYIFPVIEIGLWVGYFHFYNEGSKIEKDYEKYANKEVIGTYEEDINIVFSNGTEINISAGDPMYRYDRNRQYFAQTDLMLNANNPMYDNHFRLDDTDTQHFYEDIGKYNKYIFGWADWFDIYATNTDGDWSVPSSPSGGTYWMWEEDTNKWIGNNPQNPSSEYYTNPAPYIERSGIYSEMRAEYIDMRVEAEDNYSKAKLMILGTALNRVVSAFDALRVTNRKNLEYLAKHDINMKLSPVIVNNQISAGFFIQKRF